MDASQDETPAGVLPMPVRDPHAALPQTARDIVAAARRVLEQRGYQAVTLAKVAEEAGVNKASVLYHFRNKAGLVSALVDAVVHEDLIRMGEAWRPSALGEERVHAALEGKHRMIQAEEAIRAYYEIIPHAIRSPELRRRVAAAYPQWCEENLYSLGLSGMGPNDRDEMIAGLGRLVSAVVDGLGIQAQLDPQLDPRAPLRAFEFLLNQAMPALQEMAAAKGSEGSSGDASR